MNIFYLHENPSIAPLFLNDQRLNKMITETAQLLCTAINVHAGEWVAPYDSAKKHLNHPCTKWVQESYSNFKWLYDYFLAISGEHILNRSKLNNMHWTYHKMMRADDSVLELGKKYLPRGKFTTPPNVAGAKEKNLNYHHIADTLQAYKVYVCARMMLTDKKPKIKGQLVDVNALMKSWSVTTDDIMRGVIE